MALNGPPGAPGAAPEAAAAPYLGRTPTDFDPVKASSLAQAVSLTVVVAAVWLCSATTGIAELRLVVIGLVLGAAVGLALPATALDGAIQRFPGLLAAVVSVLPLGLLAALGFPPLMLLAVPPFLVGLDWRHVGRIRAALMIAAAVMLLVTGSESGIGYLTATVWFVAALVTLWLLHGDERRALDRPAAIAGDNGPTPDRRPLDLMTLLGMALAVGVVLALLFGRPGCSLPRVGPNPPSLDGIDNMPNGTDQDFGDGESDPNKDLIESDQAVQKAPPDRRLGPNGELKVRVDPDGGETYAVDPETGRRVRVYLGPGDRNTVLYDEDQAVARVSDATVVVAPDSAFPQRYRFDEHGMELAGEEGDRYQVRFGADGEVRVVAADGEEIAVPGGEQDLALTDRADPAIRRSIDPDGDGRILPPPPVLRDVMPGIDGRTTRTDAGAKVTIQDASDGETRTYSTDENGHRVVRVEAPGQEPRTYVYFDNDEIYVEVYDDDGVLLERYVWSDDETNLEDTRPIPSSPSPEPEPEPDSGDREIPWAQIGIAVLAIGALAGLAGWWRSRRRRPEEPAIGPSPVPWAAALMTRIEDEGARRGRSRESHEAIAPYVTALAAQRDVDPRLAGVGEILTRAFFAPTPPGELDRAWAEATVDAAFAPAEPEPAGEPVGAAGPGPGASSG